MGFSLRLFSAAARRARGPAVAIAALALPLDGAQAGFFDFLFSPQPPMFQQPTYGYPHPRTRWRPQMEFRGRSRIASRPHPRLHIERTAHAPASHEKHAHVAAAHARPDLLNDASLQDGDAVMTNRGIRIFTGDSGDRHTLDEFAKLSETKGLSKRARATLAEIDANRSEGGGAAPRSSDVVTGRSAADREISAGSLITDPRGRLIRYVGP